MSGTTSGIVFKMRGEDVDIVIYQGKTIRFDLTWGGDTPLDVTGFGVCMQIRDYAGALMLEMSTQNGGASVGGVDGKITFAGTIEDSRAVTRPGRYEIELTTPGGETYRALSGAVSGDAEVALCP